MYPSWAPQFNKQFTIISVSRDEKKSRKKLSKIFFFGSITKNINNSPLKLIDFIPFNEDQIFALVHFSFSTTPELSAALSVVLLSIIAIITAFVNPANWSIFAFTARTLGWRSQDCSDFVVAYITDNLIPICPILVFKTCNSSSRLAISKKVFSIYDNWVVAKCEVIWQILWILMDLSTF